MTPPQPVPVPVPDGLRLLPGPDHILYRLPPRMSPYRADLELLILEWADRFGLVDGPLARRRLADTHLGELIARCYPHLRAERLAPLAGWFTWAFVIDDLYDGCASAEAAGHARATLGMLAACSLRPGGSPARRPDRPPPKDVPPLVVELAEVWRYLAVQQSLQWQVRFITHMGQFLDAFRYEAVNREHRHVPSLGGYTQLRRASGGITPSLDLLEYAAGLEVPALFHESEQLRTMVNKAADVVVWVNDVLSLKKELVVGEVTNGVLAVSRELCCGIQEAIDHVYRRVARDIRAFLRAEESLTALCGTWHGLREADRAAITAFTDGMKAWMRGNLDWGLNSHRYLEADTLRLTTNAALLDPGAGPPPPPGSGRIPPRR
ncbi:terpene synthase family protein [Kitasatospora sp. NPDC003701]